MDYLNILISTAPSMYVEWFIKNFNAMLLKSRVHFGRFFLHTMTMVECILADFSCRQWQCQSLIPILQIHNLKRTSSAHKKNTKNLILWALKKPFIPWACPFKEKRMNSPETLEEKSERHVWGERRRPETGPAPSRCPPTGSAGCQSSADRLIRRKKIDKLQPSALKAPKLCRFVI